MIHSKCHYIPSKTVEHLVHIFGGADLIRALVEADIRTVSLPETRRTALIIPVPDLERFNPKPPFGKATAHTWVSGATSILIEGLIRPADWEQKGKGQHLSYPVLIGALYHGAKQHVGMKAGGNDEVQLKVAQLGVVTSSERYTLLPTWLMSTFGSLR